MAANADSAVTKPAYGKLQTCQEMKGCVLSLCAAATVYASAAALGGWLEAAGWSQDQQGPAQPDNCNADADEQGISNAACAESKTVTCSFAAA